MADNCSSAGLTLGPWSRDFTGLDNAGVVLRLDGRVAQASSTAAILGNPLRSLVQASRLLHAAELELPAGSLVMAGAASAAVALYPGVHVSVEVQGLGQSSFRVRGDNRGDSHE